MWEEPFLPHLAAMTCNLKPQRDSKENPQTHRQVGASGAAAVLVAHSFKKSLLFNEIVMSSCSLLVVRRKEG